MKSSLVSPLGFMGDPVSFERSRRFPIAAASPVPPNLLVRPRRFQLLGTGLLALLTLVPPLLAAAPAEALYRHRSDIKPRWSSPENPNGRAGQGGRENHGAKGRPFVYLKAGETAVLLATQGPGLVSRLWFTISDRSPEMLRSLKLEMFWDDAAKPAVAVPLGDFFGPGLGRLARFHNPLFASPEGRSFVCTVPMPYRTGARIQVTNESSKDLTAFFFDVDFQETPAPGPDDLYFHAGWQRNPATQPGVDFELLPTIRGRGRFLGVSVGVNANPVYRDTWWGEGEVKVFLDDDQAFPTLVGTGTEDYIGSGWGQGEFFNDHAGCLVADEKKRQWAFYRFHLPDPIFFATACRVSLQQIGGAPKATVAELQREKAPLIPITLDDRGHLHRLYDPGRVLAAEDPALPEGWMNFYRSDDVSATAYFYLDTPTSDLPPLQPVAERSAALR